MCPTRGAPALSTIAWLKRNRAQAKELQDMSAAMIKAEKLVLGERSNGSPLAYALAVSHYHAIRASFRTLGLSCHSVCEGNT